MNTQKRKLIATLVCLFCFSFLAHAKGDSRQLLIQANAAYDARDYQKAVTLYEGLLKDSSLSSDVQGKVFYNMASSYFRSSRLGEAVFYFKKSAMLLPRDGDVSFNLKFARDKAKDKVEKNNTFLSFLLLPLSLQEYEILVLSLWVLLCAFQILKTKKSFAFAKLARNVTFLFLLILLPGLVLSFEAGTGFGVVKTPAVTVYSGPDSNNVKLFELHDGTELSIKDFHQAWARIELADRKQGWVLKETLVY